ncbi:MAG: tRNA (adenosine(37)-N6)-threonylcarbamoyltransferase complex ATPase subunit type 1 TsaE [Parcubacteria group bacterium RIFCSPLOWO2_01_FULL_48_18]|nr:MAG: tRNA (adenosine(37)-N6)-threonylcarbamoyltransferase complex ATPase subunit type 1 TsaE [Parcubacteria group bacterium RIFCSPLOWO2_01_FULL_48_18]OHB22589.1 MAG: tRNA (adenosine(37)-N6)-threonylcarbamoyltransferase complex ATPase subunit type 1 TsaE [Parcubacteria group bacterium RIFCSPHIGHO2_02_FULL_48_10b]
MPQLSGRRISDGLFFLSGGPFVSIVQDMKIKSDSEKTTRRIAAILAEEIVRTKKAREAFVVALQGDLGSGKSTFARGFIRGCGIKARVPSPSFLIYRRYSTRNPKFNFENIYHLDLYRLQKNAAANELKKLGWDEIVRGRNIVLIEWADKTRGLIPKNSMRVTFFYGREENERIISIKSRR